MTFQRIRCVLWGCWCDENQACPKCGCAVYDADYIQYGKLDWIRGILPTIRGLLSRLTGICDVCGKRWWAWSHYYNCCSDKCYSKWLPF